MNLHALILLYANLIIGLLNGVAGVVRVYYAKKADTRMVRKYGC